MNKSLNFVCSIILILVLFASFGNLANVKAHSKIDQMNPDINEVLEYSPDLIEVLFADPVEIYSESIRIKDGSGTVVSISKPVIDPDNKRRVVLPLENPLRSGKYTVEILAIAQDGHEITERYQFEIKKDKPTDSDFWKNLGLAKSIPSDGQVVMTSPKTLELWFSDDVELDVIGLYDDKQKAIPIGNSFVDPNDSRHYIVELDRELRKGSYEVNWYAKREYKSKNGIFYFAVEEVTSLTAPEGSSKKFANLKKIGLVEVANWLSYIGTFLLFGGVFFKLFISKGNENLQRWRKLSKFYFVLSITGFLFLFVIRMYEFTNISFLEFIQFHFVWGLLLQLALILSALCVKSFKTRFILLFTTVFMWALSGHAVSERYGGIFSILLDGVHLFSTAIWFGGLSALLVMVPQENKKEWLIEKGKLFSPFALISIFLMFVTGFTMMYRYLPSFSLNSLMMSGWGQFILTKVVLFLLIILLGILQMRVLKKPIPLQNMNRFLVQGRSEFIIGIVTIFFASALVNASPRTAEQGIYPIDDSPISVSIEIDPFKSGYNEMIMTFDKSEEIKNVDVEFFMPPNTKRTHTAFLIEEGVFKITGGVIHASGTLYVTLHITKTNGEITVIPYEVQVPGEM